MTTIPELPSPAASVWPPVPSPETSYADGVLSGRAMSSAVFLAGVLANSELETVGRPDRLPQDLFPHVDPAVVEAIWQRALAVGLHAGRVSASPRLYRDQFARVQGLFAEAGFVAMGRLVGRSRRVVAPESAHPAGGDVPRGHGPV